MSPYTIRIIASSELTSHQRKTKWHRPMLLKGFSYGITEITFVAPDLSNLADWLFYDSFSLGFKSVRCCGMWVRLVCKYLAERKPKFRHCHSSYLGVLLLHHLHLSCLLTVWILDFSRTRTFSPLPNVQLGSEVHPESYKVYWNILHHK